jgi:hypothetical protein
VSETAPEAASPSALTISSGVMEENASLLCLTFQISHGSAEPLAVATGWALGSFEVVIPIASRFSINRLLGLEVDHNIFPCRDRIVVLV